MNARVDPSQFVPRPVVEPDWELMTPKQRQAAIGSIIGRMAANLSRAKHEFDKDEAA